MELYSQQKEATPQTSIIASSIYIKQKRFHDSALLLEEVQRRWPNQPFLPQAIAENLFYNPNFSSDFKIQKMLQISPAMPSTYFYLSILYGYSGNSSELKNALFSIFNEPVKFNMEFRGNEEKIAAIFMYTCSYFKYLNCEPYLDTFKKNSLHKDWDENKIKIYLEQLNKAPNYQINI